jgi:hypothetical protein
MFIFTWIWESIKGIGGMILPVFEKVGDLPALGRRLRWVIHFAIVIIILVLLRYLNYFFDLDKLLTPPLPLLRKIWLPMLFMLIYLLMWLGWWLWRLLAAEEAGSDFPDIDEAWGQAVATLTQAGIDAAEVPLFLLLGKPDGTERSLFEGAQLEFTVSAAPDRPDAPIQVYANKDGIFVTCAEASLLGKQASIYAAQAAAEAARGAPAVPGANLGSQSGMSTAGDSLSSAPAPQPKESVSLSTTDLGATISAPVAVEEKPADSSAAEAAPRPASVPRPVARMPLVKDTDEVERLTDRLRHLCWLILKKRRPYCPVNGVLLMIPYAATATDSDANQTGILAQRDLETVREVMQINCPVLALVTDMERAPGFRDFIDRFPKGHRQRRLGQQFPYVANLNATDRNKLVESGVDWICAELFPSLIYRLMRPERARNDRGPSPLKGNVRLFNLLGQIRDRRRRLSRVLSLSLELSDNEPIYFGGCYFAGTGRNAQKEQAFIAAVFHRMLEGQNYVSWTPAGLSEEHDYQRWTRLGYGGIIFLSVFILVTGSLFWYRRW